MLNPHVCQPFYSIYFWPK